MFPLLLLTGTVLVISLAAGIVWTFRLARRLSSPRWTWVTASASVLGAITGFACGVVVRWHAADDLVYVGFPVPGMLLHREDGTWVDYVSPMIVIAPFLDSLIAASAFVLPVTVAILIRSRRGGRRFCSVARSNSSTPSAHSTGKNAHATEEPHHAAAADTPPAAESRPADREFHHQARENAHAAAADTRATGEQAQSDVENARAGAADAHPAGEDGRAAGGDGRAAGEF